VGMSTMGVTLRNLEKALEAMTELEQGEYLVRYSLFPRYN
jgi:hypothetical protein